MNARKSSRLDRFERIVRSLLGLALLAAVVWAVAGSGGIGPGLSSG